MDAMGEWRKRKVVASYPGLPSQLFSQPWKNVWGRPGRKHPMMPATFVTANYPEEVKRYYSLWSRQVPSAGGLPRGTTDRLQPL